jgi:hypothetical protein
MAEILISVVVLLLVVSAMAVGVISGRKPIQGSCGGLGAIGIDGECEICGGDLSRCDEQDTPSTATDLSYEVSARQ